MKYWVTCPADVEEYVRDERERPRDYEEHFYPCYIEYEEPWDYHFCGDFYFLNKSREEAIAMRRENLIAYIAKSRWQITAAKHALKELDKY
jgi:hypothetical protein